MCIESLGAVARRKICGTFDCVFFWQERNNTVAARKPIRVRTRAFILSKLIKVFYNISLKSPGGILSTTPGNFDDSALRLFNFQYQNNPLYQAYCNALRTDVTAVKTIEQIPFLPISFFKTHTVLTATSQTPELFFQSSGTTGENTSRHYIADPQLYEASLLAGFRQFYGDQAQYAILALLPSYLERKNASLVYMARALMEKSAHPDNGFYINEWDKLHAALQRLDSSGQKVLLLGVTFALLDFAAGYPMPLSNTIVMETGGMKGRREELTRSEVHEILKQQWQLPHIHSEYGMTELLSQAYAPKDGIHYPTATMNVLIRDINDPLDIKPIGTGALNIIDLANANSCAFIATEDIGAVSPDGSFQVLGRLDHSTLRGCSLMAV